MIISLTWLFGVSFLLMNLFLASCNYEGTEVGNGYKPERDKSEERHEPAQDNEGHDVTPNIETPQTSSVEPRPFIDLTRYLLANCTSPFAENLAPKEVSLFSTDDQVITYKLQNDGTVLITMNNDQMWRLTPNFDSAVKFDSSLENHEGLPIKDDYSCQAVSTLTNQSLPNLGENLTLRTVTIVDERSAVSIKVRWYTQPSKNIPGEVSLVKIGVTPENGSTVEFKVR